MILVVRKFGGTVKIHNGGEGGGQAGTKNNEWFSS